MIIPLEAYYIAKLHVGLISNDLVSVFFQPTQGNNDPEGTGKLNFGGINETIGFDIFYTPITSTSPAKNYWGIDQSVRSVIGTVVRRFLFVS